MDLDGNVLHKKFNTIRTFRSIYRRKMRVEQTLKSSFFSFASPQELETRIDTQKQTLQARDESIKKLLEMLQSKGEGKLWNEIKNDDVIVGSGSGRREVFSPPLFLRRSNVAVLSFFWGGERMEVPSASS